MCHMIEWRKHVRMPWQIHCLPIASLHNTCLDGSFVKDAVFPKSVIKTMSTSKSDEDVSSIPTSIETEYNCKYVIAGASPSGCSTAYFLLKDDEELAVGPHSAVRICIVSPGRNVTGEVDTTMPFWGFPTLGLDNHIPGIKPHYTRDIGEFYYPESSVYSGGSTYNLGVIVPPPVAWFDKIASVTGYSSWKFETMLPLVNRIFNFTSPDSSNGVYHGHDGPMLMTVVPAEPESSNLGRACAIATDVPYLDDITQFNVPAVGNLGRMVGVDAEGNAVRQYVCDKTLGPLLAAGDPRIVLLPFTYVTHVVTEPVILIRGEPSVPQVMNVVAFNKQTKQVIDLILPSDGTGKAFLGAEVGNVKILEASGIGDCALLSQLPGGPIPCVLNNPHIGASFKSTFMGPVMLFAVTAGGPSTRVNGSLVQAYVASSFAKTIDPAIPDTEIGFMYYAPGLYLATVYINQYPSNSGSVHLSDVDVTSNENSVYNIGANPHDFDAIIQGMNTIRQSFAIAATLYGLETIEVDGLPTDQASFNATIIAGCVPQYHNNATTLDVSRDRRVAECHWGIPIVTSW